MAENMKPPIQTFLVLHQKGTVLCMISFKRPKDGDAPQKEKLRAPKAKPLPKGQRRIDDVFRTLRVQTDLKDGTCGDGDTEQEVKEEKPHPIPELADNQEIFDYNDLKDYTKFDKDLAGKLHEFLERQPAPFCLVAHYGNGYDFKWLKSRLLRADSNSFGYDKLMCADTLKFFKMVEAGSDQPKTSDASPEKSDKGQSGGGSSGREKNFSLKDVYKRRFKKSLESRRPDSVCRGQTEALLQLCQSYGERFSEWADREQRPMSKIYGMCELKQVDIPDVRPKKLSND